MLCVMGGSRTGVLFGGGVGGVCAAILFLFVLSQTRRGVSVYITVYILIHGCCSLFATPATTSGYFRLQSLSAFSAFVDEETHETPHIQQPKNKTKRTKDGKRTNIIGREHGRCRKGRRMEH
jgi:hypothetical protein